MTPLRQQMMAALELNGKSPATVEAYVREVFLVAKFYRKRPDLISEEELVRYLLHRKNADCLAPTSMRICYGGLRFFYQRVLAREWKIPLRRRVADTAVSPHSPVSGMASRFRQHVS
jgi:integrase/recombinase XerD